MAQPPPPITQECELCSVLQNNIVWLGKLDSVKSRKQ